MSPVTLGREMVKRNDATTKIDAEILKMARLVAEYRDVTVAEYLSELVRDQVTRDLEGEQAKFKLPRRTEPPPPKGGAGTGPRRG